MSRLRKISKVILYVVVAVYPVLVFYFLVVRNIPVRFLSLFVMAFALLAFIAGTSKKKAGQKRLYGPLSSFL